MRILTLLVAALLLAGCGTFFPGDPLENKPHFTAKITGDGPAWASLTASYSPSRRILTWKLIHRGLSGPITWAEFRGPDIEGTDSAIVPINLHLEGNPPPGKAALTGRRAACPQAGPRDVMIKTEKFPAGEIRGPVVPDR